MLRTAEAARALLGGDGPIVDFHFGVIAPLRGAQVNELPGLEGDALVLRVSAELLAQSRRDGGLAHKFGVFEFERLALGALFIAGSDALHVVLLEPAVAECRALLAHAEATGYLHVLAFAGKADSRLMRIGRCDGLDMLCVAARNSRPGSTQEVAQAVAAALEFVGSPANLASLELPEPLPTRVVTHFILTASRDADIERCAAQDLQLH